MAEMTPFERRLAAALQDHAGPICPVDAMAVTRGARATGSRRRWWPLGHTSTTAKGTARAGSHPMDVRSRPMLIAATLTAIATVVALVGGTLVLTTDQEALPAPGAPASELRWEPVDLDFEIESPRLDLDWDAGRFMLRDVADQRLVSTDGLTWGPLGSYAPEPSDHVVRWGDRDVVTRSWRASEVAAELTIVGPDGERTEHRFEGELTDAPAVASPAGVIVREYVDRDDVLAEILGSDATSGDWRFTGVDEPVVNDDIAYEVEFEDGTTRSIVLADHGFVADAEWDAGARAVRGWHSADGITWTPITDVAIGSADVVVGTEAGFWVLHDGGGPTRSLWHSPDGLEWTRIGTTRQWRIDPWDEGVLIWGDASLEYGTLDGITELPVATVSPPAAWGSVHVGPLGILYETRDSGHVFSPDGVAVLPVDLPLEPGWHLSWRAIGADSMLLSFYRCDEGADDCTGHERAYPLQLWRGTPSR